MKDKAEILQALMDGKKIKHSVWDENKYIFLAGSTVTDNEGLDRSDITFKYPDKWTLYEDGIVSVWSFKDDKGNWMLSPVMARNSSEFRGLMNLDVSVKVRRLNVYFKETL